LPGEFTELPDVHPITASDVTRTEGFMIEEFPMSDVNASSIRPSRLSDVDAIVALYRAVGAAGGGLARSPDEVTRGYVRDFLDASFAGGVALVAVNENDEIIAEIHTRPLGPRAFAHVLGDLTIAVHPSSQGQGLGRRIFAELLAIARRDLPHVLRIELKSRETNARAIAMYESLGFKREGRMENRIRLSDGSLDADIPMAWHRGDT
jgi:putative acetyltransferase